MSESANSKLTFIEQVSEESPCEKSDCFCMGPFMVHDNLVDLSADKTSK
jgi:hypothetical protein